MIRTRLLMCPAMRPTTIVAENAPIPRGVSAETSRQRGITQQILQEQRQDSGRGVKKCAD